MLGCPHGRMAISPAKAEGPGSNGLRVLSAAARPAQGLSVPRDPNRDSFPAMAGQEGPGMRAFRGSDQQGQLPSSTALPRVGNCQSP